MRPLELPKGARRAFDRLAADLARIFGGRLVSLVAFAPSASLAFVTAIEPDDLDACATLVDNWHRERLAPPLVMTPDEFRRSLDAFPLESATILASYTVIVGQDPLAGLAVRQEDLRRACEVQARSLLVHLRQGWLEAAGHTERLDHLVADASLPLRHLLTHLATLEGAGADSVDDLVRFSAERLGLPGDLVKAVLALEAAPEGSRHVSRRLPEFLSAAERLWSSVDRWQSR